MNEFETKKATLEETLNYYHSTDWKEYEYYFPDKAMEFTFEYQGNKTASVFYLQEFVEDLT